VIDFHAHLDLYPNPFEVVRDCILRNIYVLSVTTTPSAFAGTLQLADGATRIRTALGLHPEVAHLRRKELALFDDLVPHTRYVGEIGLDGSPHLRQHWVDQQTVFRHVLRACARNGGRVMSLHSRRAAKPVLDALAENRDSGCAILHWFSGTVRELRCAIDLGCWFSVGPSMLSSERGRELARHMPRERVLTESDGPFANHQGHALWPRDVVTAVKQLAELWGQDLKEVEGQLASNLNEIGRRANTAS